MRKKICNRLLNDMTFIIITILLVMSIVYFFRNRILTGIYGVGVGAYHLINGIAIINTITISIAVGIIAFILGTHFHRINRQLRRKNKRKILISELRVWKENAINLQDKVNVNTLSDMVIGISQNSSLHYINNDSLAEQYFDEAYKSLEDSNVYIVISDTGSSTSKLISIVTGKKYNHASLSFDKELKTLISYNNGEGIHQSGLNLEKLKWLFKKSNAEVLVYSMGVTQSQKMKMIERVKEINTRGSSYNTLGLMIGKSVRTNTMYCSQFVYHLLDIADVNYFKQKRKIKPTDFIELDYDRKLVLAEKIKF